MHLRKSFWLLLLAFFALMACPVGPTDDGDGTTPVVPDTAAPVLTLVSPTNGQEVGASYSLAGTVTDNASGVHSVYVKIDGDPFAPATVSAGNWSTNITLSVFGEHINLVYAMDNEGNISATNELVITRASVPSIVITNLVSGLMTNVSSVQAMGTVSIDTPYTISDVELSLNSAAYQSISYSGTTWNTTLALNEGTNSYKVRATGNNTKMSETPAYVIISDTVSPTASIDVLTNGQEVGSSYTLSGNADDTTSGVEAIFISTDGSSFVEVALSGNTWSTNISLSTFGKHTNYVYSIDKVGNVSATNQIWVERAAIPAVTINAPANGSYTNAFTILISGTATIDSPYTIQDVSVSVNGSGYSPVSLSGNDWSSNISLIEGTNTFDVRATGDNSKTHQSTVTVIADFTPPVVSIDVPLDGANVGETQIVSGTVSDLNSVAAVYVSLDGAAYQTATLSGNDWSLSLSGISINSHGINVYSIDGVGNMSSTNTITITRPAPKTWTIMVYMNGDNDLEANVLKDINEMETVSQLTNGTINLVVLVDRTPGEDSSDGDWTGTRLYSISYESSTINGTITSTRLAGMGLSDSGDADELNMADPDTLSSFVDWAAINYPGNDTMLIMWNHGEGWRNSSSGTYSETVISPEFKSVIMTQPDKSKVKKSDPSPWLIDYSVKPLNNNFVPGGSPNPVKAISLDDSSGGDIMFNSEIRTALTSKGLTVIGFDACLMGMVEVAYEMKDIAGYMIASPDNEPADGWAYDLWLADFLNSVSYGVDDLYTAIIDAYATENASQQSTTLAVYDLSQMSAVNLALNSYVAELQTLIWNSDLDNVINKLTNQQDILLNNTENYYIYANNGFLHIDPWDMADKLALANSATLKSALEGLVVYEWHHTGGTIFNGNPNSTGIALYLGTWVDDGGSTNNNILNYDLNYYDGGSILFSAATTWDTYAMDFHGGLPAFNPATVPWLHGDSSHFGSLTQGNDNVFQFYVQKGGMVDIDLYGYGANDFDLELYNSTGTGIAYSYSSDPSENITMSLAPGWYLVRANAYTGSSSYTLRVNSPGSVIK